MRKKWRVEETRRLAKTLGFTLSFHENDDVAESDWTDYITDNWATVSVDELNSALGDGATRTSPTQYLDHSGMMNLVDLLRHRRFCSVVCVCPETPS